MFPTIPRGPRKKKGGGFRGYEGIHLNCQIICAGHMVCSSSKCIVCFCLKNAGLTLCLFWLSLDFEYHCQCLSLFVYDHLSPFLCISDSPCLFLSVGVGVSLSLAVYLSHLRPTRALSREPFSWELYIRSPKENSEMRRFPLVRQYMFEHLIDLELVKCGHMDCLGEG